MRRPWLGYRRVVAQLNRDGGQVGATVVRRLRKILTPSRAVGQGPLQTTNSNHPDTRLSNLILGLTLKPPTQVWVAAIPSIRLGTTFIYLAVILDAYSRALSQALTLTALRMALAKANLLICPSHQGSPSSAWLYTVMREAAQVRISLSDHGNSLQNAIAERFMRVLYQKHVDYAAETVFPYALRQIAHSLQVAYNPPPIHAPVH
jgi:putative transposase